MKHTLATARHSGRKSESYRVFRAFRQSLILNYNLDGLASELCGKQHGVIAMHGTVDREFGSAKSAALLPHLREFDLPVTNDDILMCVPEDYGELATGEAVVDSAEFRPDFIAIIGYSFGCNGEKYDDCVSLDFFRSQFREFSGSVYLIDPQPETLGEMIADGLKCQSVFGVRAYWNVLAHVFVQILRGNCGDKSINYRCEQLLNQYGSGSPSDWAVNGLDQNPDPDDDNSAWDRRSVRVPCCRYPGTSCSAPAPRTVLGCAAAAGS